MHRWLTWLLAFVLGTATTLSPNSALARRPKVEWRKVDAPKEHQTRITLLRSLLKNAARSADFGDAKKVVLTARLVEFSSQTRGDVHHVTCTLVGRLVGGPTARSHISFGGKPDNRVKLEKQVLTMVANGLVTRLAEIARTRATP